MRKRKVIFIDGEKYREALQQGYIIVFRPMGSKLFRGYIPEQFSSDEPLTDLFALWGHKIKGVYYFPQGEKEIMEGLAETLWFMDYMDVLIAAPQEEYFQLLPEQINQN